MSSQITLSLDDIREKQVAEICERRKDIPAGQTAAVKFLLFEKFEQELGVKKA